MCERQRHFVVDKLIAVLSVLITVTNGQSHDAQPYPYSVNGFRGDLIRFPEDTPSTTVTKHWSDDTGDGNRYSGYQSSKRDTSEMLQRSTEVSFHSRTCGALEMIYWIVLYRECRNSWEKINI